MLPVSKVLKSEKNEHVQNDSTYLTPFEMDDQCYNIQLFMTNTTTTNTNEETLRCSSNSEANDSELLEYSLSLLHSLQNY